ncbi:FecR domain-containing protein [Pseudomonas sp. NPDC007930]|uniref:FecR domain-containing protein n=1 Tax=Pseudomonas sp. NPDC007930 TaxID=3364417 RepID=UPI0036EAB265
MSRTEAADAALPLEACEQAMQWWLELQGNDADAPTLAAFAAWRGAHPSHERAWQRAQALATQMGLLRQAGDLALAKRALLTPAGPAISRRRALTGLALLLAAGGAWRARDTALLQPLYADYSTATGEQRRVRLSSQLELLLNTRSAVNARRSDTQWRIDLLAGEVLVDTTVAPPLQLYTGQLQATAANARFSARQLSGGGTLLAVLRGTLQASPVDAAGTLLLKAGEQAYFSAGAAPQRSALEPAASAWAQGMLVAHGQPLQAFLGELGRYRQGHLGCDEALANLPVWGTFPVADSERAIDAVATTLKLEVQRFTRLWVNLRQPAGHA